MQNLTTVIFLSSIEWNFTWQRHQVFATVLAERGFQVIFVDPLPKRVPSRHEVRRVLGRLLRIPEVAGYRSHPAHTSVEIISPIALPDVNEIFGLVNRLVFLRCLRRQLKASIRGRQLVVITYLPFPGSLDLANMLSPDLLIYDCVTRWAEDKWVIPGRLREIELFRKAHLVLADSPFLCRHSAQYHPRVVQLPPGVDIELFDSIAATQQRVKSEGLTCCYFGGVNQHIDVELLAKISYKHRLRIVGPVRTEIPHLASTAELVGVVGHPQVPKHLSESDVIILPYRINGFTEGVFPAKTFESLATGMPIVATPLPSLLQYDDLIYVSATHDEFLQNIERAANEHPILREQRIKLARENTWERRIDRLEGLILDFLSHFGK